MTEVESVRSVCVVLLSGLGDVVHGLPVVNALKRDDPTRRITWVVEPLSAPLLRHHPSVDEVVVFDRRKGIRGVWELARAMAGRRWDLTLNFNIYFKSVFPTLLSRAPVRVGLDRRRSADGVWLLANVRTPPRPRGHTQDMFLEMLEVIGVETRPVDWRLSPTPEEAAEQGAFFARFDRPVAAIVPASANPRKDWIPERYAAVIDALDRDFGMDSVIVGGPSEREARLSQRIVAAASSKPTLALGDGIRRLVWLLGGSRLVIAPDTGPVHIARAMEVPVIGLYGHTNPWRVGPWRHCQDLWVDVYTERGAAPDPSDATPKLQRMEGITEADVLERVARAVERYRVADPAGPADGAEEPSGRYVEGDSRTEREADGG
ncbi:MAG: glycosyltransferase family 9 protein [Gemmatimonadetes bacterium]|nr:glycosyltransferase family 9 protein [Gemmatimonadota bacterium]